MTIRYIADMHFDNDSIIAYDNRPFDSVEEMKEDVHRIVACNATVSKDAAGNLDVNAVSLQNEDMVPEYRLLISEEEKNPEHFEELIPWQEEPVFHVEKDQLPAVYTLRLEVRQQGQDEYDAFQNLK